MPAAHSRQTALISMAADESIDPGTITFYSPDGRKILIIHDDGRLERGDGFANDDQASVAFFNCLSNSLPTFLNSLRQRCEIADAYLAQARGHVTTH